MKDIEFRAISIFTGTIGSDKFIYGSNIRISNAGDTKNLYINGIQCNYETLDQYIGKKDKNGVKIFQNDIIKLGDVYNISYVENDIVLIEWDDYTTGWIPFCNYHSDFNPINSSCCEIIGNKHQNKDLLIK